MNHCPAAFIFFSLFCLAAIAVSARINCARSTKYNFGKIYGGSQLFTETPTKAKATSLN